MITFVRSGGTSMFLLDLLFTLICVGTIARPVETLIETSVGLGNDGSF
jgi:hypothetical protein